MVIKVNKTAIIITTALILIIVSSVIAFIKLKPAFKNSSSNNSSALSDKSSSDEKSLDESEAFSDSESSKNNSSSESKSISNSKSGSKSQASSKYASSNLIKSDEVRGVWISSVYNLDFPSKPGISSADQKKELDAILSDVTDLGLNTIFFQVRPCSDALYKSKLFPVSEYLTGTVGGSLKDNFDPLDYIVKEGHKKGIKIHAWVNPLRVTNSTSALSKQDILNKLAKTSPARLHPEWVVKYPDGKLYLNPGIPEVRKLIIDGVTEIVQNYSVDGIHFDDYFYPYPGKNTAEAFDDAAEYKKYGASFKTLADFRRDNIDKLVKGVYDAVKAKNKNAQFGISPFAVWANIKNNPLGSDTNGGIETFYDQYADTRKWVKSNWLDYICPQVYWSMTFSACSFPKVTDWWADVTTGTNVKLYTGHAAYKAGDNADKAWDDPQELIKQIAYARNKATYDGSIFFGYSSIKTNKMGIRSELKKYYSKAYIKKTSARSGIIIAGEKDGLTVDADKIYLSGWANPAFPLLMNNKRLNLTASGYFSSYVSLKSGSNVFRFNSDKNTLSYTVTRAVKNTTDIMKGFEISSPYPGDDIVLNPGETVFLKVTAPAGSVVSARIGAENITLSTNKKAPGNGVLIKAEYTGKFTIPKSQGNAPKLIGNIYYTAKGFGKSASEKSKGGIYALAKDAKMAAEVSGTFGWVKESPKAETLKNSIVLTKGAVDYITGYMDGCYRLKNGGWILKDEISIKNDYNINNVELKSPELLNDKGYTVFSAVLGAKIPYRVFTGDGYIKLQLFGISKTQTQAVKFASNPLFREAILSVDGTTADIIFRLTDSSRFYGYKAAFENGKFILYFKNPVRAKDGAKPLEGIKIALNPGHGAGTGALGPIWESGLTEDDLNLDTAFLVRYYLREYGATVYMTREMPEDTTLKGIIEQYNSYNADLALSIHYNSVARSKDAQTFDGMFMYYSYPHSKSASEILLDRTSIEAGRKKQSSVRADLYVTRFYNYPSVLAEMGFVSNINEYEWFENESNRDKAAKALADGVLEYFRRG